VKRLRSRLIVDGEPVYIQHQGELTATDVHYLKELVALAKRKICPPEHELIDATSDLKHPEGKALRPQFVSDPRDSPWLQGVSCAAPNDAGAVDDNDEVSQGGR
jgi:hypothetical protein